MKVHQNIYTLAPFRNAVVTIGTFDGVHTGHRKIIQQLRREAEATDGEAVIITFHPHPRMVVKSSTPLQLINSFSEKLELPEETGIDHLVVVPFTEEFAQQSAQDYVSNFLVARFQPHTIIIGYDHRFGKNRQGDYRLLEELGASFNYRVKEIPEQVLNEITVSSTRIRQALTSGDLQTANDYLGYPFFFEGRVVLGNQLGRTLGYPTANLEIEDPDKLVPANGVYAVQVSLTGSNYGREYKGMMNIGTRPTIDGKNRVIEVHIFEFSGDIYGENLRVYLKKRLRAEEKFNGLEALKEQLAKDRIDALEAL